MTNIPAVKNNSWFVDLSPAQQELIFEHSTLLQFKKDETIIKQGFMADRILYLEEGMAKLSVEDRQRSTVFKIIADDTFIGLMCSFVKRNFDFSAIAIQACTVRLIDRSIFEQMIRENGKFAVHVVQLMSLMTNKIVHDLVNLSHKNVDGAVCTVLTELASIFKSNTFLMPFSRVELANTVGYSKESVIGCLTSLQKEKIINASGKKIEILDMNRLQVIAKNG
ncbi:MAG: Crp/Fnr family transcriptional regulator [Bacteroidales bacterium]|jgi:CRP-like cAMP-binding protein|nr:Crp/Fnr family transcriptional regulator [Bacteroidales bacterium]